ncbi:hypothetical protein [Paenibacillus sp. PCH8]|uniref:hypothetical protein n=1 Tax=Paenibacillus sp. PCH8 TaxID=2066524 RepID=UPI0015E39677|nr:hypothetical protein [Paenibacillus sp. PCH8]
MYKAGFWIRLGASILDSLIISIPLVIIAGVLGMREDRRAIHDFIAGTEVVWD